METSVEIREIDFDRELAVAQQLTRDYRAMLPPYFHPDDYARILDQRRDELNRIPERFGPPGGAYFAAFLQGEAAGCVALSRLDDRCCQMNRFFVKPDFRGRGIGRKLIEAVLAKARALGYDKMRLTTATTMNEARSLYRAFGFTEIDPYTDVLYRNPIFMEKRLV